jgi:hypothetical protein
LPRHRDACRVSFSQPACILNHSGQRVTNDVSYSDGSTEYVTYTSTSLIKTVVPTTIVKHVTSDVTKATTVEEIQTTTCYETTITTVIDGSTTCITETMTSTIPTAVTHVVTKHGDMVTQHSEVVETLTVPTTEDYTTTINGKTTVVPTTKSITTTIRCDHNDGKCDYKPSEKTSEPPAQTTASVTGKSPLEAGATSKSFTAPAALLGVFIAAIVFF